MYKLQYGSTLINFFIMILVFCFNILFLNFYAKFQKIFCSSYLLLSDVNQTNIIVQVLLFDHYFLLYFWKTFIIIFKSIFCIWKWIISFKINFDWNILFLNFSYHSGKFILNMIFIFIFSVLFIFFFIFFQFHIISLWYNLFFFHELLFHGMCNGIYFVNLVDKI